MIRVEVTGDPISISDVAGNISTSDGALVVFAGVVRDHSADRPVEALDYEAYKDMAEAQMIQIAGEALRRWPVTSVAILHRTGLLEVGETSVVVGVSAPHRAEAFDACEFCIDTVKKSAAIWKKEVFADGTSAWVEPI